MAKFSRAQLLYTALVITLLILGGIWTYFSAPRSVPQGSSQNASPALAPPTATSTAASTTPVAPRLYTYLKVTDSCNWAYVGQCVNMRSGSSTSSPIVDRLRNGIVLKVSGTVVDNGVTWYRIQLDTDIRFPDRITNNLFVAADGVQLIKDVGDKFSDKDTRAGTKKIVISKSKEMLYAYDGNVLYMEDSISTGLEFTPTPQGTFSIFKKTPSRYMQGPLPGVSEQVYDLPGVPWDLYFTGDGAVIHGAYWHNKFGQPWSHGCVNLQTDEAEKLYKWVDIGTPVIVQN